MNESTTIDFASIEGPVYTGRERGTLLRDYLKIPALEADNVHIRVSIPDATYTISSSFFLGLFGPSVIQCGSKEAFYKKYEFVANEFLKSIIDGHVDRALQERNLFK